MERDFIEVGLLNMLLRRCVGGWMGDGLSEKTSESFTYQHSVKTIRTECIFLGSQSEKTKVSWESKKRSVAN